MLHIATLSFPLSDFQLHFQSTSQILNQEDGTWRGRLNHSRRIAISHCLPGSQLSVPAFLSYVVFLIVESKCSSDIKGKMVRKTCTVRKLQWEAVLATIKKTQVKTERKACWVHGAGRDSASSRLCGCVCCEQRGETPRGRCVCDPPASTLIAVGIGKRRQLTYVQDFGSP